MKVWARVSIEWNLYRRKRSLGQGNIITGVCQSFCPGVGVGELCMMSLPVWLPGPIHIPSGGCSVPGPMFLLGVSVQGAYVLGVSVQGVSVQVGLRPGGVLVQRVSLRDLPDRPLCTVKSGRYASYWNAFLFLLSLELVQLYVLLSFRSQTCGNGYQ